MNNFNKREKKGDVRFFTGGHCGKTNRPRAKTLVLQIHLLGEEGDIAGAKNPRHVFTFLRKGVEV